MSVKRIKPKPLTPTLGLDDRMEFGKYQGRSILYIIGEEPSYIKWLIGTAQIKLSDAAHAMYQKSVYAQRYDREIDDTFDRIIHRECHELRNDI